MVDGRVVTQGHPPQQGRKPGRLRRRQITFRPDDPGRRAYLMAQVVLDILESRLLLTRRRLGPSLHPGRIQRFPILLHAPGQSPENPLRLIDVVVPTVLALRRHGEHDANDRGAPWPVLGSAHAEIAQCVSDRLLNVRIGSRIPRLRRCGACRRIANGDNKVGTRFPAQMIEPGLTRGRGRRPRPIVQACHHRPPVGLLNQMGQVPGCQQSHLRRGPLFHACRFAPRGIDDHGDPPHLIPRRQPNRLKRLDRITNHGIQIRTRRTRRRSGEATTRQANTKRGNSSSHHGRPVSALAPLHFGFRRFGFVLTSHPAASPVRR